MITSQPAPTTTRGGGETVLECRDLVAGYDKIPVLTDVNLQVRASEIVVLLGRNGAGKTTTLSTLSGLIKQQRGTVDLCGRPASGPAHRRVRDGLAFVGEERTVLMSLTVQENLRLGCGDIEAALDWFPELKPHLRRRVGMLSGGQQQMLSVGRALASQPKVLVADELSLGLAPVIVTRLLEALIEARSRGVGVLLVEQHAELALDVGDYAYLMDRGSVVMEGTAIAMKARLAEIERTYLAGPSSSEPAA